MAYTIPQIDDSALIEQEFDLFDWKIRTGNLAEVREFCSQVLACDTTHPRRLSSVHILSGTVDLLQSSYESGLRHFEAAHEAPLALRCRARAGSAKALTMLGRTCEAQLLLQHLVTEWPDSWYAWEAMGTWERETGNDEGAWRAFLKAAGLNPGNPSLITSLVAMGLVPGRYNQLAIALENHLALEPLNMGFRGCLVNCFLHTGEVEKACDQARRIVLFAPFSVVPPELVSTMNGLLSQLESI